MGVGYGGGNNHEKWMPLFLSLHGNTNAQCRAHLHVALYRGQCVAQCEHQLHSGVDSASSVICICVFITTGMVIST